MDARRTAGRGFSFAELLTVLGLIALVLSLLLPVIGKVRVAANSAACLSNLRQMGTAWLAYSTDNRGQLMHYVWSDPESHERAYSSYWPGVLSTYQVRGQTLLCPDAREPSDDAVAEGLGNVTRAWTGRFAKSGTWLRLNDQTHRDGSYGYNRFLTAGGGFGGNTTVTRLFAATDLARTPVFMDCADADVRPVNGTAHSPPGPPPNLQGSRTRRDSPEHWKLLLSRHGRGINVVMADGSARWTRLEDVYLLNWRVDWVPYRLNLPAR